MLRCEFFQPWCFSFNIPTGGSRADSAQPYQIEISELHMLPPKSGQLPEFFVGKKRRQGEYWHICKEKG